jgi:hypothetical protein
MQLHLADVATVANFLVLLGIYGKVRIMAYQHKLMWTDFAKRKGISGGPEEISRSKATGVI